MNKIFLMSRSVYSFEFWISLYGHSLVIYNWSSGAQEYLEVYSIVSLKASIIINVLNCTISVHFLIVHQLYLILKLCLKEMDVLCSKSLQSCSLEAPGLRVLDAMCPFSRMTLSLATTHTINSLQVKQCIIMGSKLTV